MRIETERLILRPWEDRDRPIYAAFNADPEVRRFFHPPLKTAEETNVMVDGMIADLATHGYGFLAVERKFDGVFIGEAGLAPIDQLTKDAMLRPADIEIGWFFGKDYWGNGYATEAARAWLSRAWDYIEVPEIIAFTYVGNLPSRRVMEKLGMTYNPADDFEDPTVPAGHWQRPHVVYRARNPKR